MFGTVESESDELDATMMETEEEKANKVMMMQMMLQMNQMIQKEKTNQVEQQRLEEERRKNDYEQRRNEREDRLKEKELEVKMKELEIKKQEAWFRMNAPGTVTSRPFEGEKEDFKIGVPPTWSTLESFRAFKANVEAWNNTYVTTKPFRTSFC